jgi:hypothetical protein
MQTFYQILGLLGFILVAWILYKGIKNRPEQFTKANLSKSFFSMGVLGVILIVFVAFLIFLARS